MYLFIYLLKSSVIDCRKYEEIDPKPVEKFCDMTENTYTKHEVSDIIVKILF